MAQPSTSAGFSNSAAWTKTPNGWIEHKSHCPPACPQPGPSQASSISCAMFDTPKSESKPSADTDDGNGAVGKNNCMFLDDREFQDEMEKEAMQRVNVQEMKIKLQRKLSTRRDESTQPARKKIKVDDTEKTATMATGRDSVGHLIATFQTSPEPIDITSFYENHHFVHKAGTCDEYAKRGNTWIKKQYSKSYHDDEEFEKLSREERYS